MGFKKGNKLGKGRPKGSKNLLPKIRDRILNVLQKRLYLNKNLDDITTQDLLRFAQSIMPRDIKIGPNDDLIEYYTNTPRPIPFQEDILEEAEQKIGIHTNPVDSKGPTKDYPEDPIDRHGTGDRPLTPDKGDT